MRNIIQGNWPRSMKWSRVVRQTFQGKIPREGIGSKRGGEVFLVSLLENRKWE